LFKSSKLKKKKGTPAKWGAGGSKVRGKTPPLKGERPHGIKPGKGGKGKGKKITRKKAGKRKDLAPHEKEKGSKKGKVEENMEATSSGKRPRDTRTQGKRWKSETGIKNGKRMG